MEATKNMRALWILAKIIFGIVVVIPLSIIVLATVLGLFGALVGLAVLALKLAAVGLIAVGLFKLGRRLFGGSRATPAAAAASLPSADPYYRAAMRELDRELGEVPHSR